ncbi:hypothetical protein BHE97_06065 [Aeromicrobium sp. PE09-221]|uniref:fluoride efflux transporter FluC n=1 Tax=Aeromicrobium sp. PE09-221 TaxID=1898043 RepID=UPI000B3ED32A|nr:CrcB family protein [Aeromicrobium sp. PE09-221]OUZ10994.1 hypothetical protein BHE97_06065 [Aeromicrobium sp. PE09-221]
MSGIDPDLPTDRPAYRSPWSIALVLVGGTMGTACREALSLAFPPIDGVPVTILLVNIAGAFLLGVLLAGLVTRGPDIGRRRALRLLAGTGFLGGFTTYSALAADTVLLADGGALGTASGYALVTLLAGAVATWTGVAAGMVRRAGGGR